MNQRYYSLDVFRGATVALMILVNNPGSWEHIYSPLEHASWHGCTPTDLVFPFFLFAVGNALSFVMPRFEKAGNSYFLKKVFERAFVIFLIGLWLNWSPFFMYTTSNTLSVKTWTWLNKDNVITGIRILGVLQRIALCYLFASLIIYFFKVRLAFVISCFILLGYWILCLLKGNPADPFTLHGYFGTALDIKLLGIPHIYKGEGVPFDPEGIGSLPGAIVQVIFGYLIGHYIQQKGKNYEMLSVLLISGSLMVLTGYCWDMVFPINKKIWTSSYTIYTTGLATITLALLIYLIEFRQIKGAWSKFFDVFGKNPLFIFVLSGFLPRLLGLIRIDGGLNAQGKPIFLSPFSWFYEHICKNVVPTDLRIGSLLYALIMIAFYWLIVYILDRKKIYIKV